MVIWGAAGGRRTWSALPSVGLFKALAPAHQRLIISSTKWHLDQDQMLLCTSDVFLMRALSCVFRLFCNEANLRVSVEFFIFWVTLECFLFVFSSTKCVVLSFLTGCLTSAALLGSWISPNTTLLLYQQQMRLVGPIMDWQEHLWGNKQHLQPVPNAGHSS